MVHAIYIVLKTLQWRMSKTHGNSIVGCGNHGISVGNYGHHVTFSYFTAFILTDKAEPLNRQVFESER